MSDNSKVFSFSTKTASDREFVDKLKADNAKIGRKFSWVVIQALRAHYEGAADNGKTNREV